MKQMVWGVVVLIFLACSSRQERESVDCGLCDTDFVTVPHENVCYTATEQRLLALGLVDLQTLDPTIQVSLVYATPDNFLGKVLYSDLRHALLLPAMAQKIADAQQALHQERPDLNLLVLDAVRPISVQYNMFHTVAGTRLNRYVANPRHGPGMHNYGAAVDVTLADSQGRPLPMGSDFDHFGIESHIDNEDQLLANGKITREEYDNRLLLRRVMRQQGLIPLSNEWWHFNLMSRAEAQRRLKVVDI